MDVKYWQVMCSSSDIDFVNLVKGFTSCKSKRAFLLLCVTSVSERLLEEGKIVFDKGVGTYVEVKK